MTRFLNDPLLSGTKVLLRIAYRLIFALAVVVTIVGPLGLLFGHVSPEFADMTPERHRSVAIFLLSSGPVLALYGWFLRSLWQIIDTIAAGSPFLAVNADRLTRMAWLALAIKLVGVAEALIMLGHSARPTLFQHGSGSLFMALTLFILARVFRQGAAMREDLEGTV